MKWNRIVLVFAISLMQTSLYAQFLDADKNEIADCDCKKKLNELYYKIPAQNYTKFDLIGVQLKTEGGTVLTQSVFRSSAFGSSSTTMNLLDPENMGVQNFIGMESGLFGGKDLYVTYSSLCGTKKDYKVHVELLGINQIGTETEYEVVGNKVKANTKKIYDHGTSIHESGPLNVKARQKHHDKLMWVAAMVITPFSYAVAWASSLVINSAIAN